MANALKQPRDRAGRYSHKPPCDGCGRPCTGEHYTDEAVCGGTDGPGFYVCERKSCAAKLEPMTVEERREHYTAQRAKNDAKKAKDKART